MSKTKLFAKIVYYVFTISIGLLLAFALPVAFMSEGEFLNMMEESLNSGKYDEAMLLVGGYFDKEPVFLQELPDGGGIVLFKAATLVYSDADAEDKSKDETQMHLAYAGFVYGVKRTYNLTGSGNNQAKVVVTDVTGVKHPLDILDYDTDNDKINDTNLAFARNGFFYMDLDMETFLTVQKLTVTDKDGNVFAEVTPNLEFREEFFSDVSDFVAEYNRDYKSDKLQALNDEFLAKNPNYTVSSAKLSRSRADTKAAILIVVYFVVVYAVADLLLGKRYIIRFFRWLLVKVFKVKFKTKPPKEGEAFGNDYYCKVTFVLDVSGLENFSESVQIRYTDDKGEEIQFILLKEQNYTATERVKAGTYVNMWIDIDKTVYGTQNLPETLVVEGYQKALKIKILKREE